MSFNWRLLLRPGGVLDYVIERKSADLEVLDHSRRFWRLLGSRVAGLSRARALAEAQRAHPHSVVSSADILSAL